MEEEILNNRLEAFESKNDDFINDYYKDDEVNFDFDEEVDFEITEDQIERIGPNIIKEENKEIEEITKEEVKPVTNEETRKYKKLSYKQLAKLLDTTDNSKDFFKKVEIKNDK